MVEFSHPVIPHHQNVDSMVDHVIHFLAPRIFNNHLINEADGFDDHSPVRKGVIGFFLFDFVEFVTGQAYDQIFPQSFCPAQEIDVAAMQNIIAAVCDDSFTHKLKIRNNPRNKRQPFKQLPGSD